MNGSKRKQQKQEDSNNSTVTAGSTVSTIVTNTTSTSTTGSTIDRYNPVRLYYMKQREQIINTITEIEHKTNETNKHYTIDDVHSVLGPLLRSYTETIEIQKKKNKINDNNNKINKPNNNDTNNNTTESDFHLVEEICIDDNGNVINSTSTGDSSTTGSTDMLLINSVTPLLFACDRGLTPVIEYLLRLYIDQPTKRMLYRMLNIGFPLDVHGSTGSIGPCPQNTPLHHAASSINDYNESKRVIQLFLEFVQLYPPSIIDTVNSRSDKNNNTNTNNNNNNNTNKSTQTINRILNGQQCTDFTIEDIQDAATATVAGDSNMIMTPSQQNQQQQRYCAIILGLIRNEHGDTPLHVACSSGNTQFLISWYQLAKLESNPYYNTEYVRYITKQQDVTKYTVSQKQYDKLIRSKQRGTMMMMMSSSSSSSTIINQIQYVLQVPNNSGDTCLTLACCDCHTNVVLYLLDIIQVQVQYNEIEKVRRTMDQINTIWYQASDYHSITTTRPTTTTTTTTTTTASNSKSGPTKRCPTSRLTFDFDSYPFDDDDHDDDDDYHDSCYDDDDNDNDCANEEKDSDDNDAHCALERYKLERMETFRTKRRAVQISHSLVEYIFRIQTELIASQLLNDELTLQENQSSSNNNNNNNSKKKKGNNSKQKQQQQQQQKKGQNNKQQHQKNSHTNFDCYNDNFTNSSNHSIGIDIVEADFIQALQFEKNVNDKERRQNGMDCNTTNGCNDSEMSMMIDLAFCDEYLIKFLGDLVLHKSVTAAAAVIDEDFFTSLTTSNDMSTKTSVSSRSMTTTTKKHVRYDNSINNTPNQIEQCFRTWLSKNYFSATARYITGWLEILQQSSNVATKSNEIISSDDFDNVIEHLIDRNISSSIATTTIPTSTNNNKSNASTSTTTTSVSSINKSSVKVETTSTTENKGTRSIQLNDTTTTTTNNNNNNNNNNKNTVNRNINSKSMTTGHTKDQSAATTTKAAVAAATAVETKTRPMPTGHSVHDKISKEELNTEQKHSKKIPASVENSHIVPQKQQQQPQQPQQKDGKTGVDKKRTVSKDNATPTLTPKSHSSSLEVDKHKENTALVSSSSSSLASNKNHCRPKNLEQVLHQQGLDGKVATPKAAKTTSLPTGITATTPEQKCVKGNDHGSIKLPKTKSVPILPTPCQPKLIEKNGSDMCNNHSAREDGNNADPCIVSRNMKPTSAHASDIIDQRQHTHQTNQTSHTTISVEKTSSSFVVRNNNNNKTPSVAELTDGVNREQQDHTKFDTPTVAAPKLLSPVVGSISKTIPNVSGSMRTDASGQTLDSNNLGTMSPMLHRINGQKSPLNDSSLPHVPPGFETNRWIRQQHEQRRWPTEAIAASSFGMADFNPPSAIKPLMLGSKTWADVAKRRAATITSAVACTSAIDDSNSIVQKGIAISDEIHPVPSIQTVNAQAEVLPDDIAPVPIGNTCVGSDHETVMNALCLDASMLLHSSDTMADTLSPCQLDAIEQILLEQMRELQQARYIQQNRRIDIRSENIEDKAQQCRETRFISGFLC